MIGDNNGRLDREDLDVTECWILITYGSIYGTAGKPLVDITGIEIQI